ncbi:phage baseplate protein [uncultured Acidaminococcus sp.]|uniref:phage baseplate protein n=1 Tax=uncultured Acidaminococcus sp. TaxID=352152 RepID=UPI00206D14B3|nr:hypothetical protein [uncultured Acidaminococcus sp.]DAW31902.1 MAG TPA: hypothetical protein [Caudoviricetes sp.]
MGVVGKGLSLDRIDYYADIIKGKKPFQVMDFARHGVQDIARLTGHYKLWNFMTGYDNLTGFLFRTPTWPIGGVYFDGIMKTEHVSRIKPTQYPVQTGVTMTDHAIVEPAELSIEVMMTDAETSNFFSMAPMINVLYSITKIAQEYSVFKNLCSQIPSQLQGDGRSAAAWTTLRAMQVARTPITVETRLQTYDNMIIEELSAPDDVKTLNAFRCTVRLREIFFATVAETQVSKRAAALKKGSSSGQQPVNVGDGVKKTTLKAGLDKAAGKG